MKQFKINVGRLLFAGILAMGCSDNENIPYQLNLVTSEEADVESGGEKYVELTLNKAASENVEVSFDVKGTAALNGDYELLTLSPVTIVAGQQSAKIEFELIDDAIIEQDDKSIIFQVTDIDGISLADDQPDLEYNFTITDNDEIPDDNLQVDLTWTLGEGKDIDDVDLDLYLAKDIVIEDDMVSDFTLVEDVFSANESGFESMNIDTGLDDDEYYVLISYNAGSSFVDYVLGYSYSEFGNEVVEVEDSFSADEEGYAVFYGPINKSGTSFGRTSGPRFYRIYSK